MKKIRYSRLGHWILSTVYSKRNNPALIGDFEEIYSELFREKGYFPALAWYWSQIIKAVPSFIFYKIFWNFCMFKNYLKITLRNIKRQKIYSFINITGLATGLACFILILLYVQNELSYDRYHENSDDIYRIVVREPGDVYQGTDWYNLTQGPLKNVIINEVPGILNGTRISRSTCILQYKDKIYREEDVFLTDPEFLEIFTFPLLSGNSKTAINEPFSILISKNKVKKYFGNENPVGKYISLKNKASDKRDYIVTGILEDIPGNSHFKFDFLISYNKQYSNYVKDYDQNAWGSFSYKTYVLLGKKVDLDEIETSIKKTVEKHSGKQSNFEYHLQQLTAIHLGGNINHEIESNSDIRYVYLFSAIAFFILLIACFNYMNLATAKSAKRATEIGIRKVVGANRINLVKQFIGESLIFTVISLIISLILVYLTLPAFSKFIERKITFGLLDTFESISGLILLVIFVGIISASYPAVFLSSFNPVTILKGSSRTGTKGSTVFRNTLVLFQFAISIALIVCTMVVFKQLNFIQNRNLGFEKERILTIYFDDLNLKKNYRSFCNEIRKNPNVLDITSSIESPHSIGHYGRIIWEGFTEELGMRVYLAEVDYNFIDFYDIKIIEGRNFTEEISTDGNKAFILSKSTLKAMGWETAVGRPLDYYGDEKIVIGVIDDVHFRKLNLKIEPFAICLMPPDGVEYFGLYISVKLDNTDIQGTLSFIENKFKEFSPDYPFLYRFLDERINRMYKTERKLSEIFVYFTIIAILIACLGLFGLASYTTESRIKEIGIRKVMGASVGNIVLLLSQDFIKWIVLSAIIAFPIAYYSMNKWLLNFAYRINIGLIIFLFASGLTLLITFLTVGYQSVRAAVANPVESLRNE